MSGFPLASMFLVFPLVLYMIFCGDPILLEEGGGGGLLLVIPYYTYFPLVLGGDWGGLKLS